MRKSLLWPAMAMLTLAGPAMAGTFSYSMLEGSLIGDSIDDPNGNDDLKGSGLGFSGSWALNPGMFGFVNLSGADYQYRHAPDDHDDFSSGKLGLGVGFHFPLGRKLDFVSGISLQRLRLENDYYDTTLNEEGYGLDLGLRGMITERLQWTLGMHYVDYGRDGDDTSWSTGLRYYFTREFAVGVDIGSTDRDQANGALVFRWDIGNR